MSVEPRLDNGAMPDGSDRLRALVDAGIALNSELSLDALLQRLVETAAELTAARYAALGVIDESGRGLERFLTTGIDAEAHAAIGDPPSGRGILGVLIREAEPLLLDDIADDPRSVGFPPHHPPMKSFLGVPILQRGVAYGNLYLSEKDGGGPFTEEDLELTKLLAAQAAVAIENARLYESTTRWLHRFQTLNEIGIALASELELTPLLDLVARRLRELIEARIVLIALPGPGDRLVVAAADGEGTYGLPGMQLDLDHSKMEASSTAAAASGSTPSSRTPRSTRRPHAASASTRACTCRSSRRGKRSGSSSRTTTSARTRVSTTTTFGSPRPSPPGPRSQCTCRSA